MGNIDLNVATLLLNLEEKHPSLRKISFYKAYEIDNILAIVLGIGDINRIFSGGGRILRELTEKTGKRIRLLEKRGDIRKFFEDLFSPAPITTINKIWLPDGSTETRVILSGRSRRLPLETKVLKELAQRVRGITLRIDFERQLGRQF